MLKLSSSVFFKPTIDSCAGYYLKPSGIAIFTMTFGNLFAAWSFPSLAIFAMGNKSFNESLDPSKVLSSDIPNKRKVLFIVWRIFLVSVNLIIYAMVFYHVHGSSVFDTLPNVFIKIISIIVQSLILFSPLIIYVILNNLLYTFSLHRESNPETSLLGFFLLGILILIFSFVICISLAPFDCL